MTHPLSEALGKLRPWQKQLAAAALVLLLGILLLTLPSGTRDSPPSPAQSAVSEQQDDAQRLEARLSSILSQIEGAGKTEVLVTLSAGSRRVLATDEKVGERSSELETVLTKDGSSQQSAVTVQTISPELQGVLVVCDGGGEAAVRLRIMDALKALTGLSSEQISICARAGGS